MKCETLHRLLGCIPGMWLRGLLVKRHEARCPICQQDEKIPALGFRGLSAPEIDLWPDIQNQLEKNLAPVRQTIRMNTRWLLAGVATLALVILIPRLLRSPGVPSHSEKTTGLPTVHFLNLSDRPAKIVFYRVDNPGRLIVWAAASNSSMTEEKAQ